MTTDKSSRRGNRLHSLKSNDANERRRLGNSICPSRVLHKSRRQPTRDLWHYSPLLWEVCHLFSNDHDRCFKDEFFAFHLFSSPEEISGWVFTQLIFPSFVRRQNSLIIHSLSITLYQMELNVPKGIGLLILSRYAMKLLCPVLVTQSCPITFPRLTQPVIENTSFVMLSSF